MSKITIDRLEIICQRLFKNVNRNGDWVNFGCALAPYTETHKFREDSHPSAGVSINRKGEAYWHCFTCKGAGPLKFMLQKLNSHSPQERYVEALKELDYELDEESYEQLGYIEETEKSEPLDYADIFDDLDKHPIGVEYVTGRNVSLETAKKLDLKYDTDGKKVVFPVKSLDGRVYGFTGRSIDPNAFAKIKDYYFKKSHFILGMEHWNPSYPVIIVEGLFAYARLHEMTKDKDFKYNIGAIMGSKVSLEQINILLEFGSPVFVLLDNDLAGWVGMFGKPQHHDWSEDKKELEKAKGLVYRLYEHVPTFVCKWPRVLKEDQLVEKTDPDELTYDELAEMLSERIIILG